MTRTAVQLRETRPSGRLLHGAPIEVLPGPRGPIALFGPDALVAYLVESSYRPSLFVFRTLVADDRLAASVPGVRPRVHLLLDLHRAGRVRQAQAMLAHLLKQGLEPSALPETFWLRLGFAFGGRHPPQTTVVSLMRPEPSATRTETGR
jgi:hypothetical protein